MELFDQKTSKAQLATLKLTVVYDNIAYAPGLDTDLGFACLVEGPCQTLLFDSGRLDATFMANLAKLGLDSHPIAVALLSHEHHDHIGGLPGLLKKQPGMQVYLPGSFSSGYKKRIASRGAEVCEIRHTVRIGANMETTGEMRGRVKNEHSLVVRTDKGAIVITGCAHPGILDIVQRARRMTGQDILLVMGGFHLLHDDAKAVRQIIEGFQQLGVRFVAPSHCTGDRALKLFAAAYGSRFIRSGAGRVITADDLLQ